MRIRKISEVLGMRVHTDSGEYFGEIEEANLGDNKVDGWRIKVGGSVIPLISGAKGVIIPHNFVKAISDIVIINRAALPSPDLGHLFIKMINENFKLSLAKLANDASISIYLLSLRQDRLLKTEDRHFVDEQLCGGISLCKVLIDAFNIGLILQESKNPYQQLFSSTIDVDINLFHFIKEYKNYFGNMKTSFEQAKLIKKYLEDIFLTRELGMKKATKISNYFSNVSSIISETLPDSWDEIQKKHSQYYA